MAALDGDARRPDGKVFHLTLSLARGHEGTEAEELTAAALHTGAFTALPAIELDLRPAP